MSLPEGTLFGYHGAMKRVYSIALITALCLSACGEDKDEDTGPQASGTFDLGGDAKLVVDNDGSFELTDGDRTLFASAPGFFPTIKTVAQDERMNIYGVYENERSSETPTELSTFGGIYVRDGFVELHYSTEDGATTGVMTAKYSDASKDTQFTLTIEGAAHDAVSFPVRCDDAGSFHGFGEQYNATDQRGEAFDLVVEEQGIGREGEGGIGSEGDSHTTYFPMPYYLDGRGFGVLFETNYRVAVDVCAKTPEAAWFEVGSDEQLSIWVFHGPTGYDVIKQLGDKIGRPTEPPEWAWELWMGLQGGTAGLESQVTRLEAENIPAKVLWVQDWTGRRPNLIGGFGVQYRWEAAEDCSNPADPGNCWYPDLAQTVAAYKQKGYRFLAYVNPFVMKNLPNHFTEMDAGGWLVKNGGASYLHPSPAAIFDNIASHPDLTNADAVNYVQTALEKALTDYDFDGWMADFGEWLPLNAQYSDGTPGMVGHQTYPVMWQSVNRAALEAVQGDDWVMFTRSGFTGSQATAQIVWVGDQETNFLPGDGIGTVVPAMLNLGLSGIPYVTHDIAGFSGTRDKETWMRWVELGAFTPVMRTHEGTNRDKNWQWYGDPSTNVANADAETVAHFGRFARIHAALGTELKAMAAEAALSGKPMVRHLMLEWPEDKMTWSISDEYMLGDELLVAPVVEAGVTSTDVYLPAGTWYHVFTGTQYEGGQTVTVDAPMGQPPVFSLGRDREDLRMIQ